MIICTIWKGKTEMKIKSLIAVLLCGLLLTGCTDRRAEVQSGPEAQIEQIETGTSEENVTSEIVPSKERVSDEAADENASQASAGNSGEAADENLGENLPENSTEDSQAEEAVRESFTFNPHICPKKLYEAYSSEEWEAFFNLCDALRAGEDTFKCANRMSYEWCFSGGPLDEFFPLARFTLDADFVSGYSNGVGQIRYNIPKEEFLEKQKAFEQLIVDILNENVRQDYTDFEKCLALYEYMVNQYEYDWEEYANNDLDILANLPKGTYGTYRTFYDKKGICDDLSSVYNYLLRQCGVEALKFTGGSGSSSHAWSYVTIDGAGYFIDPTWGISERGSRELAYFMTTDSERLFYFDKYMGPQIFYYDFKNKDVDFSASDDRYAPLHNGKAVSMNRKSKILKYSVDGRIREFHYDTQNE